MENDSVDNWYQNYIRFLAALNFRVTKWRNRDNVSTISSTLHYCHVKRSSSDKKQNTTERGKAMVEQEKKKLEYYSEL